MLRFWLYCAAILLYIIGLVLDHEGIKDVERLSDLWYFAFLVVCFDFVYRTRNSLFMVLPLYKALYFLYQFLQLPAHWILMYSDGIVHAFTAALFFWVYRRINEYDNLTGWFILGSAILWLFLGLRVLTLHVGEDVAAMTYNFNFPFYILAAVLGKVLASPFHSAYLKKREFEFSGFALFYALIVVFRVFIDNLYNNWHIFGF